MHFVLPKFTIAALVFTLCNSYAQSSIPSGWRKIEPNDKFSFYLPPDMRDTGVRGIENLHHEYTNGRMHLSFDYEPMGILAYSNRARAFGKNYQETELLVDGRKSFLFVYQSVDRKNRPTFNADLYVGDLPNGQSVLHMWMSSRSAQYVERATTIFQTIKLS